MKLIIDITEEAKQAFDKAESNDLKGGYYDHGGIIGKAIQNGIPLDDVKAAELDLIRDFIVKNIVRNPYVFIKCQDIDVDGHLDIMDIIVGLYDMLHKEVTGENYDYMWHWANKIGFWCDDAKFYNRIVKGETDGKET